jgi:pimeloyl-ACP methyl ester carboxylesterase
MGEYLVALGVARTRPDAQLAIIPGASHTSPIEKPGFVNQILLDFLADEQSPKFFTRDSLG